MWNRGLSSRVLVLALVAGMGGLLGCTDEKIVFRDREPFNPPPDISSGFLGYYTASVKQTTCGNCHVGVQAMWQNTKHADAWEDLQASGHASATCEPCHTVNSLGNTAVSPAGYEVVQSSDYHDVQCESCHGPGFVHVQNPTQANQPLASIQADTALQLGCGGCHNGTHHPFVEQWQESAHGSGAALSHAGGNASCAPCHEGKGALEVKFGVTANFLERDSTTLYHITCVVCHDPHGSPNTAQLRASISTPTTDNLCITCHSRSGVPPWGTAAPNGTSRGAHGAQGLLVLGQNVGWIPPGFVYDTNQIVSSHGTSANPRLCATCHVAQKTVTDNVTGAFSFQSVGHLFEAIPCLDSQGIPVPGPCTLNERDFSACATSGCHGTAQAARSAFISTESSINNLLDQIWLDTDANGVIDPTDGGLVAQLLARATAADSAQLDFTSNVTTVAKGTLFNAALAATDSRPQFLSGKVLGETFSTHPAAGNGVHNPFLLEALLSASISAMKSTYGLAPPRPSDITIKAIQPPGVRRIR
ncbi:MAG: cytochrome c3 family protein [Gemmatimonadales bacterium]